MKFLLITCSEAQFLDQGNLQIISKFNPFLIRNNGKIQNMRVVTAATNESAENIQMYTGFQIHTNGS